MGKLYNRADIINFMNVTDSETTYNRMKGFTENGKSLNPSTYERRYVDEKTSRKDVTGYATEIAYNFDREVDNEVHDVLVEVHEKELTGKKVIIITVNLNEAGTTTGSFAAKKREYSVIPDADGDGTDAYQYSGTFAASGEIVEGIATTTDEWITCSFTANGAE